MIFKGPCDVKMECGWGRWVACIVFLGRWEEMVYISYKDIWRKSDIWGNGNLKCFAFTVRQLSQTPLYIYASYNRHSIYMCMPMNILSDAWVTCPKIAYDINLRN